MPFWREALILSRMRSPAISRSNWAKDKSTFSVSRPMEVVVLNCWVTATNDTPCRIQNLNDLGEVGERARQAIDLVDDDHIDALCPDIVEQPNKTGPLHVAAGEPAVVTRRQLSPAFVILARNVGRAGFPLRIERVEFLFEPVLAKAIAERLDGSPLPKLAIAKPTKPPLRWDPSLVVAYFGRGPVSRCHGTGERGRRTWTRRSN